MREERGERREERGERREERGERREERGERREEREFFYFLDLTCSFTRAVLTRAL